MILVDHDSHWEEGGCNYTQYLSAFGAAKCCFCELTTRKDAWLPTHVLGQKGASNDMGRSFQQTQSELCCLIT